MLGPIHWLTDTVGFGNAPWLNSKPALIIHDDGGVFICPLPESMTDTSLVRGFSTEILTFLADNYDEACVPVSEKDGVTYLFD
jgi:hypothetical protein